MRSDGRRDFGGNVVGAGARDTGSLEKTVAKQGKDSRDYESDEIEQ
jgi:hypothetical protein